MPASLEPKVRVALLLACAVLLVGIGLAIVVATRDDGSESRDRPNVVFVMADDMRPDEMEQVANIKPGGGFDWVRDHGVRFDKLWTTNNLCCPGRTTALTGQTTYNHKVLLNQYHDIQNSLPLWLQRAGYCTGFTGKYLNGYNTTYPRPAGWTYWEPLLTFVNETGFRIVARDGSAATPKDVFITDHLAKVARSQLDDCLDGDRPAFINLWPFAPHLYSDTAPKYEGAQVPWRNDDPTFNEPDISDKPAWLQRSAPLPKVGLVEAMEQWNYVRVRTLLSVDDALKDLIDDLDERRALDDTVFILTSDNGYLLGEHRLENVKQVAYEAAQPALWIAGPGFAQGAASDAFAMNIDIAPTVLRASGAEARDLVIDGRALQQVLAEPGLGHDRFLAIYVPPAVVSNLNLDLPAGEGVRTWHYKYLKYTDGSEELYDLRRDPFEATNVAADPTFAAVKTDMITLLARAKACAGDTCRTSAPINLR
jgi:arylsulfatase A-like enzyme